MGGSFIFEKSASAQNLTVMSRTTTAAHALFRTFRIILICFPRTGSFLDICLISSLDLSLDS